MTDATRPRVFCASLTDVFEDWSGNMMDTDGRQLWYAGDSWTCEPGGRTLDMHHVRKRLFHLIDATPNLDWMLLTKRPENIRRMWVDEKKPWRATGRWHRDNVFLGTTVENQAQVDKRIPELLKCRDLAPVLFLSCEPLLGPVDLTRVEGSIGVGLHSYDVLSGKNYHWDDNGQWTPSDKVDWVIAGGESGPNARPSHPDWFRSLRDQCQAAGVPLHFKQWGRYAPAINFDPEEFHDIRIDRNGVDVTNLPGLWDETDAFMDRFGQKDDAGRMLDGVLHSNFPVVNR